MWTVNAGNLSKIYGNYAKAMQGMIDSLDFGLETVGDDDRDPPAHVIHDFVEAIDICGRFLAQYKRGEVDARPFDFAVNGVKYTLSA